MKTNEKFMAVLRVVLGVFMIAYALNKFFHFIPTSYGEMPANTQAFLDAVAIYLPYLYIFEILVGVLLIINKWSLAILIALFPLSVSFMMFSILNRDLKEMWPAVFVALLNVILLLSERERLKPLFA
ncbi:DoxX family membrane protein [Saccharicrinis sp. FJH54]|uniref:DoxX family membrane protein n=1 Tax=Saccharicrinis sp. FJH54 TaxID=3344665 RepID=UPI0035D4629C